MNTGKKILALGSGSISRPCVQYLLRQGHEVAVVDLAEKNVARTIAGHPLGIPVIADAVADARKLIGEWQPDVVACLLPTAFLVNTAAACVEMGVSMVGASYINEDLMALDAVAKDRRVRILCEVGVDPGIDHMSAVAKIREIERAGGVVKSFWSVCGALPDLGSNNNPLGYKLSWAPASLVGASRRSARIMENGRRIELPDGSTYQHPSFAEIGGVGWFESYANADSLNYVGVYGIPEAHSIYRGTLRYPGWCDMITQMQKLDLFDEAARDFTGETYATLMKKIVNCADATSSAQESVARFLQLEPFALAVEKLAWLGLFDDEPVTPQSGSLRDVVSALYARKLVFAPGEMDIVIMQHRFEVEYGDRLSRIVSTMIDRGSVDDETAIARTTGLPVGICAHLIATGAVENCGVLMPTTPDIYVPALAELAREGITFTEEELAL